MTTETQRLNPLNRGWRWLNSMGLAIPLIAGLVLTLLIALLLVSNRYQAPEEVSAGPVTDYEVGAPIFFEDERFWIVKMPGNEIIALYDRDPVTGCTVPWDPNHRFMGVTGWFRDACSGSTYDYSGACFDGQCGIGLNRLNVRIEGGEVFVDPRDGVSGALRDDTAEPLSPP